MFFSIAVAASLVGQTAGGDADATRENGIRAVIRQLEARDYATREQASRQLWRYGLAAEPALRAAANSRDAETRLRAKQLLRDFEYGILPDVPVDIRQAIRQFRDAKGVEHQQALRWLVEQKKIRVVERLVRFEPDPQTRRSLLLFLFQSPAIVDRYIVRDRIRSLVDAVGFDQDESWKRAVTMQLMFAPNTLSRLAETGTLSNLPKLIREENDPQQRQLMLAAIFRTPAVGVVLARNELGFLLDALRAEPDLKIRGEFLEEIFANPQAAQAIVTNKQLDAILTFSREQTDAAGQQKLIERLLASGPIVESMLKDGGVDRVIALVSKEADPVRRGRLLGAAISSSAVRTFLQQHGLSELAVKLAKEETNDAARHEFLQALLHDTSFVYSLNDERTIAELWQLIKADKNAVWRAQTLIVLLQTHRSNALFQDKDEAAWILKLASDDATGPIREDILRFLLPNAQAQRVLIENGHFETMLSLARNLPIRSRGEILANFLAGADVADHLVETKRIELMIQVVREDPDATVRQLCLQGVFRNSKAMTPLLEGGHYHTFLELIQNDADAARQASLFGAFVQNYRVMDELIKRGDSKLLLTYAETENEGARRQFLPRLFQNQRAVTLLMDEGHFDRLVTLAKQDGGTNFDEFLAAPKVIEHLAATKRFDLFLDFAANEADDNTRRNLLRNVFVYPKTVEALIASENFARLLRLIQAERDPMWRASLLGPVISSPPVVTHFATLKKLDDFLAMISDEPEPVVRIRLMAYLTSRSDTLNIFIERGSLDALITLANQHATGKSRGDILAQIVTNAKALERIKADQRVGLLLSYTGDADADFVGAYISRLFAAPNATDLLVEHGYYGDIFKIATTYHDIKLRNALIGRLLYSQKAVEQMIVRNDVGTLVSIIKSEADANSRRASLATICGNERLVEEMLKSELFESLMAALRSEPDASARKRQLATVVFSAKAVARLAADGQLAQILSDAVAESDPNIRASWLGSLFGRPPSFEALVELGYGLKLLDATETGIPVTTQQSLMRTVFSNNTAVHALIEQGHFERLLTSAKRHGGSQLDDFVRSPIVLEHMTKTDKLADLLRFAADELDPNAKHDVLYTLVRSDNSRKALLDAGQFETLCAAIQSVPDANRQAMLLGAVFSSPDVVQHYIETKTLNQFFAFIEREASAKTRAQILASTFGRGDVVDLLVEQGHFDDLLRITQQHTSGETRDHLRAQLLTSSKALAKLVEDKKVDLLLSYATEADGRVSVPFFSRLLNNQNAVGLLIDRGNFVDLYKLATLSQDPETRNSLVGQLLTHHKAIEQLTASGQWSVILNYAKDETDAGTRRAYVARLCSNQRLVGELIQAELFDSFVELCESEPDGNERRRQFAALLNSAAAIDKFAMADRLESLVDDALAEPDENRRHSWLNGVIGQSQAFPALMRHGCGDRLVRAAEQELDPSRLQSVYRSMVSNSAVISELAKSGQHQFLMQLVADEPRGNEYPYFLYRIVSNEDALRVLTSAGKLNELLDRVAKVSNESYRESLQRQILVSRGTMAAFAEQEKLPALFELIRRSESAALRQSCLQSLVYNDSSRRQLANLTELEVFVAMVGDVEARYRSGIVMRLVSDPDLRRRWIEAGKLAELEKLIELLPDEAYRVQHRQNLFYTPAGVLGHLLRHEQFGEVETLLEKHNGDRAMSWVVSYRASRGQLDSEIKRLRQKDVKTRSDYETRLLSYLLRASGDLVGATEIAESIGDARLLRPLLVERRKWSEAAVLQAESPLPPPVDVAQGMQQDENTQRVEQLGMLASCYRLAGDEARFESTVAELVAFAAANQANSQLVWDAAQALLLNDRVDEGLRLVRGSRPLVAFKLFAHRNDYQAAFETVGCGEHFVANRDWYDALPFGKASADVQKRFEFAIEVARLLRLVGREEAAGSVFSYLEELIESTPIQGVSPARNQLWQWYSGGLYRIGSKERAWNAASKVIDQRVSYPPAVLSDVFGTRAAEARVWWSVLHLQNSVEKSELRLQRIDDVMNPTSVEAVNSFPDLARQAMDFGASGPQSEWFWRGLAGTCTAFGQQELAIECFEHVDEMTFDGTVAYADLLLSSERWADAANAYHEAWSQDYDQLGLLFLAGVAKQRAGEVAEGEMWQRLAELHAVTPRARYQLALALTQRGLNDAANGQWQILLRTAPFESLELNDAARQLAMNAYGHEPELAAPLWQHYLLGDVRPAFWFLNDVSYLSVPALLHKTRALDAIKRNDFKAAEAAVQLALALSPGDTNIAEEVVPLLDAAEQRELADRVISHVVRHYEKLCEVHPKSALLHNNLAWATARCHRRLDEALLHAEKAVELEPISAGYIDTLAEVHFHLGDRDEAIRLSERSVALRPTATTLQAQLARFRSAPLPTP